MGSNQSSEATSSSLALTTFEIVNEAFVSIGAGFMGVILLTYQGIKTNNFMQCLLISGVTVGSLLYVFQYREYATASSEKVIFITGCDSGIGFSLALHACEMGFTVLAGCLNLDSDGAKKLRNLYGDRVHHIEIDVTRKTSVEVAMDVIYDVFKHHTQYRLWAVVNNAGVMVFGEFEWLTEKLIAKQVEVNLLGTFRITKNFCPLLRQYGGRIITVSSHCGLSTLPGLSVYGATKTALLAWNDGIRVELQKYGISVVGFIPGSFAMQSNILAHQKEYTNEMLNQFTPEQNEFYGSYFKRYNSYLQPMAGEKELKKIDDVGLYKQFEKALLEMPPKPIYINEPIRYSVYHTLFKYSPVFIRDYLVNRFMQMPKYEITPPKIEIIV